MSWRSARETPHAFGRTAADGTPQDGVALLERARQYLAAIEASTDPGGDPLGSIAFYHPDARQEELPNRLIPTGAVRDVAALGDAALRGRGAMRETRYSVRSVLVQGTRVALETTWTGVLAVPFGTLAPGDEMRAHFAMFLDFEGDLIIGQRNYDCFEPF